MASEGWQGAGRRGDVGKEHCRGETVDSEEIPAVAVPTVVPRAALMAVPTAVPMAVSPAVSWAGARAKVAATILAQ